MPLDKSKFSFDQFFLPISFLFLIYGFILRTYLYLQNHSLWLDEAWVGVDVTSRSFHNITTFKRLYSDLPDLPLIFSYLVKLSTIILENNELALRLMPFMASIVGLVVFYFFARRFLCSSATVVAIGLFSMSPWLVYYAGQLKAYAFDVLVVMIVLLSFDRVLKSSDRNLSLFSFGILAAGALWASHAMIFLLPVLVIVILFLSIHEKNSELFQQLIKICVLWGCSFFILYKLSLGYLTQNEDLNQIWHQGYLTVPLWSKEGIQWLCHSTINVFKHPLEIYPYFLGVIVFFWGCVCYYAQDKTRFFILILPIVCVLLAGIFNKYPFYGRLLLFTVPLFYVFLAQGVVSISKFVPQYQKVFLIVLAATLFFNLCIKSFQFSFQSEDRHQNRQTMKYLKEHYKLGDALNFNLSAQYAFWYYVTSLEFPSRMATIRKFTDEVLIDPKESLKGEYMFIRNEEHAYNAQGFFMGVKEVTSKEEWIPINEPHVFKGSQRSWFFFSHIKKEAKDFMLASLDRSGERLQSFEANGASVYLYELSEN